uniref:Uncharacterized protein n=1 Tax=Anguilla anguilla TaxID=7936 RepID=A0A0E9XXD3_ANGAN
MHNRRADRADRADLSSVSENNYRQKPHLRRFPGRDRL